LSFCGIFRSLAGVVNDAHLQSTLLGWIIPLALAVSVLLRRDKDLRQKMFVLFAGNITVYYLFAFLYAWRGDLWLERISLAAAILIPQGGLRFFRAFSTGGRGTGRLGGVATVLGLILLGAVLYPAALKPAVGPAVLAYVLGFMLVAILNLNVQASEAVTRVDAARIRYLAFGGLFAVAFQLTDHLDHVLEADFPPFGLAMTLIYLYIISQTITRYRLLDLYEMIGRFFVLFLMGVVLAAIYYGLVSWADKSFPIMAFLASLIILLLFDPLRELVEDKITDFFLRERRIMRQDVANLRVALAHVIDIDVMISTVVATLERARWLTHGSVYLMDPHGRGFDLRGARGPTIERVETLVARRLFAPDWVGGALVRSTVVQRRERLLQEGDREGAADLNETFSVLEQMNADVLMPVGGDDELFGLLAVGDERLKDPFASEDVVLLRGLAGQLALVVESSRLYRQTKERDWLAVLGQLSAGLAHEIRNPLGSIKGAAQVIEDLEKCGGAQPELLSVIVSEVDRLNRVVSDFLTYARPTSGRPQLIDVNELVQRTVQILETGPEARLKEVDLVVDLADDLHAPRIDGERLHQVMLNLVLNALHAMDHSATRRLEISTRDRVVHRRDARGEKSFARFVEIRFADSGCGLEPETLEKIFIPFFTTKQEGSGLGLSVCQRLVRDAGGDIEVRSQPNQGSIFTVVLPADNEKNA
jgi:two-component system, NtrC family, sensor histidine kinase HydH